MSDSPQAGILYTEHSRLKATAPGLASLWSFETRIPERGRRRVMQPPEGSHEYWLDRSDPLVNTILPGTGVSVIFNFGDMWAPASHRQYCWTTWLRVQVDRRYLIRSVTQRLIL